MKIASLVLAALVLAVLATLGVADALWRSGTAAAVARMEASVPDAPAAFAAGTFDSLPAPVARYLRAVLREGAPLPRRAVVRHEGLFRADSASGGAWAPFRSVQHIAARAPGFVWDARIRMVPGLDVNVRDELAGGEAAMRARFAGLVPVVEVAGTPELAAGALHRWLGEAVWCPSALLPSEHLAWSAIDDSTARVTATAGAASVWLDVRFGPDSLVEFVSTPERMRDVGGRGVPTPWRATLSEWTWRDGARVPAFGVVEWQLPSGRWSYWRGRLASAAYE